MSLFKTYRLPAFWHYSLALFGLITLVATFVISPLLASAGTSSIAIDEVLQEWNETDRLDLYPWQGPSGDAVYNRYDAGSDSYVFAIRSAQITAGNPVTIYINSDQNTSTGYNVFGIATGVEYSVTIIPGSPATARLNQFIDVQTGTVQTIGSVAVASSAGALEIAIPKSLLQGSPSAINVLFALGTVYLPSDYSLFEYTASASQRPARNDQSKRIAIVYSATTAAHYFNSKAYSQLFMAMQNQAMMAGLPYDLLTEDQLLDVRNLVNYDAIVFPLFSHIKAANRATLEASLTEAVYRYHIGLLSSGDFMTNEETGAVLNPSPYRSQNLLFGVAPAASGAANIITLVPGDITHPIMKRYSAADVLRTYQKSTYTSPAYHIFEAAPGFSATTLVTQKIDADTTPHSAVLATSTGGRNVHFGTDNFLGDTDIAWSALRWMVYGDGISVAQQMGRQKSIFTSRNDVDESKYYDEYATVELPLSALIDQWKAKYGFVGTYFINIGNNIPELEYTDWARNASLYKSWIAKGNEIGDHSYTHPSDTNLLTDTELQFEFAQSKAIMEQQLGIPLLGAAIPGNPDSLETAQKVEQLAHFSYLTGSFSGIDFSLGLSEAPSFESNEGAGFHNAFGFLTPSSAMLYLSPNMTPDFTMILFRNQTPEQAQQVWKDEYTSLQHFASQPIVEWHWHDYGPTSSLSDPVQPFSLAMFEETIKLAANDNAEFVTAADLLMRIPAIMRSTLNVNPLDPLDVQVSGNNLGTFSLLVDRPKGSQQVIQNVDSWYAYNDQRVFESETGGHFKIHLGTVTDDVTHITAIPMRAHLMTLSGDGTNLSFTFVGEGTVTVQVKNSLAANAKVQGADTVSRNGATFSLSFNQNTAHTVSINSNVVSATPTPNGSITATRTPTTTGTVVSTTTATSTAIATATRTSTPTASASPTSTGNVSTTALPTGSATPTRTTTSTPSPALTAPATATATKTPTLSATQTATAIAKTPTPLATASKTATPQKLSTTLSLPLSIKGSRIILSVPATLSCSENCQSTLTMYAQIGGTEPTSIPSVLGTVGSGIDQFNTFFIGSGTVSLRAGVKTKVDVIPPLISTLKIWNGLRAEKSVWIILSDSTPGAATQVDTTLVKK